MKNISHIAKEFNCDYNSFYLLIKQHKIPFVFNQQTKDIHVKQSFFDKLLNIQSKYHKSLFSIEKLREIKQQYIPISQQYFIYFLFNNDELIYIGQSCALVGRTQILALEAFYIDKYKPKHNIVHSSGTGLIKFIFEALNKNFLILKK